MGFRQLVQKFERITPIISILQDKQNGWLFYGFSSTDSNVRRNTTNHLYSLTLFRLGGRGLTPPRFKSFITHERLRLQCSYFVTFPQIYLGTIWCC